MPNILFHSWNDFQNHKIVIEFKQENHKTKFYLIQESFEIFN
jgi:hypothetical protein